MADGFLPCGGPSPAEVVEEYADDLLVSIILCRLEELRGAGCEGDDCFVLAGRLDLGLERAVDLVGRGCPPDLALRILL